METAAQDRPTPAQRGFRLPAEWEPQESVWLAWPRDPLTWPDRLGAARAAHVEAMRLAAVHQRVDLIVHPDLLVSAQRALAAAGIQLVDGPARAGPEAAPARGTDGGGAGAAATAGVALQVVDHQDSWLRDTMPFYLVDPGGRRLAVKFRFDAWGGKYENLRRDDAIPDRLAEAGALGAPMERVDMVLEGGSIDSDGAGTLLTTRQCLLHANRNPDMDQAAIEAELGARLGARKLLWLGQGIAGDDTDGHVDDFARFVAPGKVVAAVQDDPAHPDHDALAANREALESMTDARGRPLEVIGLPMPATVATDDGTPLPASHANFLITDGCMLMPAFGGPTDDEARQVLEDLVDRPIVPLDCRDLVWGMGAIHCLSMQVPRAR